MALLGQLYIYIYICTYLYNLYIIISAISATKCYRSLTNIRIHHTYWIRERYQYQDRVNGIPPNSPIHGMSLRNVTVAHGKH